MAIANCLLKVIPRLETVGVEPYKYNFEPMDFFKMSAILSGLSGKFIMSINDEPFIRETFSSFKIQEVDVRYSVQKEGSQMGRELLISNC